MSKCRHCGGKLESEEGLEEVTYKCEDCGAEFVRRGKIATVFSEGANDLSSQKTVLAQPSDDDQEDDDLVFLPHNAKD